MSEIQVQEQQDQTVSTASPLAILEAAVSRLSDDRARSALASKEAAAEYVGELSDVYGLVGAAVDSVEGYKSLTGAHIYKVGVGSDARNPILPKAVVTSALRLKPDASLTRFAYYARLHFDAGFGPEDGRLWSRLCKMADQDPKFRTLLKEGATRDRVNAYVTDADEAAERAQLASAAQNITGQTDQTPTTPESPATPPEGTEPEGTEGTEPESPATPEPSTEPNGADTTERRPARPEGNGATTPAPADMRLTPAQKKETVEVFLAHLTPKSDADSSEYLWFAEIAERVAAILARDPRRQAPAPAPAPAAPAPRTAAAAKARARARKSAASPASGE